MTTLLLALVGLSLLFIIKGMKIDLTSKRMLNLFVLYWLISILLVSLHVYNLRDVDVYTYFLVYLGVISFCIGFLLVAHTRKSSESITKEDIETQVMSVVNNAFYRALLIGASIYIYTLLSVFFGKIMLYGTLSDVRTDYYAGDLYGPLFAQINAFVLHPMYLVTLPLFAYLCLYKRNWVCFAAGFFLFGYESIGGGRIGYIRIALGVLFIAYCLLRTFKNQKKKGYSVALVGTIAMFALLVIVSGARKGEFGAEEGYNVGIQTAAEHLVTYTAGPIVAFDYSVEKDYSKFVGGKQYGNLTLTPVLSCINLFTSRLGFSLPIALNTLGEYKQEMSISVSPQIDSWNALYTANLYFYNDLGTLGVILFPLLFGVLISFIISKMYKNKNLSMVIIISFCFWCMMDSVLDYAFISPYDFLTLIVLYLLGTLRNNSLKKKRRIMILYNRICAS